MASEMSSIFIGIGLVGSVFGLFARRREQERDDMAFRELVASGADLSPRAVWDTACERSRQRRAELLQKSLEAEAMMATGGRIIALGEGLRQCRKMAADPLVPDAVKLPILEHWAMEAVRFFWRDFVPLGRFFADAEAFQARLREIQQELLRETAAW